VGIFRLGWPAEVVIQAVFDRVSAAEAEGSMGRQFDLQIHSFDDAGEDGGEVHLFVDSEADDKADTEANEGKGSAY
jgi:hypothetical protein